MTSKRRKTRHESMVFLLNVLTYVGGTHRCRGRRRGTKESDEEVKSGYNFQSINL